MSIRISGSRYRWQSSLIPYLIDSDSFPSGTTERTELDAAIQAWNSSTRLRLSPRDGELSYVVFTTASSQCGSAVGRVGGRQEVRCDLSSPGFGFTSILHEIGHAAGLWHEHSREDRDAFVKVHLENVVAAYLHNFDRHVIDGDDIGSYDYGSLMHYGPFAFAANSAKPTITAEVPFGGATTLSQGDVSGVNGMYSGEPNWVQMSGKLRDVAVGARDVQLGVNVARHVWRREGNSWRALEGSLRDISVGDDGAIWGTNHAHDIWKYSSGAWQAVEGGGKLRFVSVGSSAHIWGTNAAHNIYRWAGDHWEQKPGKLRRLSVAGDGTVLGVNGVHDIYRWGGSEWEQMPGKLIQVSVGSAQHIWGVNKASNIYRWTSEGWEQLPGKLRQVSVAADGTVWGVNSNDDIYRWGP